MKRRPILMLLGMLVAAAGLLIAIQPSQVVTEPTCREILGCVGGTTLNLPFAGGGVVIAFVGIVLLVYGYRLDSQPD